MWYIDRKAHIHKDSNGKMKQKSQRKNGEAQLSSQCMIIVKPGSNVKLFWSLHQLCRRIFIDRKKKYIYFIASIINK